MLLKNIVIHQIIKEQFGKPSLKTSDALLPVNDDTKEFVEKIIKSYAAKNPTYGIFEEDQVIYPFQGLVKRYLNDNQFYDFSLTAMDILEKEIDKSTTTGGYVVFIDYTDKKSDFLITIMLDNSTSFSVNDTNLTLKKLKSLDIDKLARANRVNITKWQNDDPQYLSFIKGTRGISIYFQKFIGSTDLTSSKENTEKLKLAMANYMTEKKFKREQVREVYSKVNDYSVKKYDHDEDLEIKAISVLINDMEPEDFMDYLKQNEDLEVSGAFRVTQKSHIKFLTKEIIKEKGYTLEFDRKLRGTKIRKVGNTIVIKDIPADILRNF
ncbi:Nucleoid-associated protein YejK [Arenibacter nanhaiticus]|uniref:Nucleoid-associated protein YejK n=1 Tax=Arenibacter nanhaiticus TaxID=558155 RepID=A0A1M6FDI4_9FLAO|nr:nucleoid-associated protein [Arenibacter nanhaiticus]SHI95804.1 Nucleoid-associated protein YejK [Arenibacter nanhaiticus]